jgi:hypothetical protein
MALEVELETYGRELPNLIAQEGKQIVICGERIVGCYDTLDQGIQEGLRVVGPFVPFFIHEVRQVEPVHYAPWAVYPPQFI